LAQAPFGSLQAAVIIRWLFARFSALLQYNHPEVS